MASSGAMCARVDQSRKFAGNIAHDWRRGLALVCRIAQTPARRVFPSVIFGRSACFFSAKSLGAEGRDFESLCPDQPIFQSGKTAVTMRP